MVTELISRDRNHPSVVMWSVANEPDSEHANAAAYFKHLVAHTRTLDPSRPVTFATFKSPDKEQAVQFVDVLLVNRYYAWYTNTGQLDIIHHTLFTIGSAPQVASTHHNEQGGLLAEPSEPNGRVAAAALRVAW